MAAGAHADHTANLRRLGEALKGGTADVVARMLSRSADSGHVLDTLVEDSFARVGSVSTIAVARWMAGDGAEVAREVGRESWRIFGQLAAQRAAPLNEVTKRCLRWRDAADDVLRERAVALELPPAVLVEALSMLQRSLDVTLVRMCESFEEERRKAHDELSRRQEELAFLATHDPLTGLPNRTLILDRIEQMLVRGRRSQAPVAALFIDLDNFKGINDTLGHGAGDRLLKAVAERLRGAIRDTDALGRLGGDEFVVIAEGMSLAAGPELIAERLLEALAPPFKLDESESTRLAVTASVGIAMGDRPSAEDFLRDADIAMYRAKWDGRNRFVVFESGMQDAVQNRMELEMDLREALEKEELFLVYQPTFDLQEMSPTGVEALLRWNSPSRGVVQPDDFVPLLEETGLITEIGRWVMQEATRQAAAWRESGYPIGVSVNVSARQLDTDEFVGEVRDALAESGLDPGALTIEITETTIMRDAEETARRLTAVKAARGAHRDRRLRHRLLLALAPPAVPRRRAQDRPLVHRPADPEPRRGDPDPHARAARQGDVDRDARGGHRAVARAGPAEGRAVRQRTGLPVRAAARRDQRRGLLPHLAGRARRTVRAAAALKPAPSRRAMTRGRTPRAHRPSATRPPARTIPKLRPCRCRVTPPAPRWAGAPPPSRCG